MNLLITETRLSNTELRMNMTRISDKIDQLLQHPGQYPGTRRSSVQASNPDSSELLALMSKDLETIKSQTGQINTNQTVELNESDKVKDLERALSLESSKVKVLDEELRAKEEHIEELVRNNAAGKEELERLKEEKARSWNDARHQSSMQLHSEMKKVITSAAKFMVSQFEKGSSYQGEDIQMTVKETLLKVNQRLADKFKTQGPTDVDVSISTVSVPKEFIVEVPSESVMEVTSKSVDIPINMVESNEPPQIETKKTNLM